MPCVKTFAALSTAALLVLSSTAHAQTPTKSTAQANPAAEHLTAARAALNKVLTSPAPSSDAFAKMSQIKNEYLALEKAAGAASPDWAKHYQTIDVLLTDLLGPAPAAAAEPGATGTSGSTAAKPLDPALTANLLDFRTHLTAFSKAMAGVVPPAAGAAASAAPSSAAPPPATPPSTTPESVTPPPATAPAAADATVVAQLDQVVGTIDNMLKANASGATVSIERSMLEQIKTQLEQVRASVKKQ